MNQQILFPPIIRLIYYCFNYQDVIRNSAQSKRLPYHLEGYLVSHNFALWCHYWFNLLYVWYHVGGIFSKLVSTGK